MLEFFRRHRGAFLITLTIVIIISFSVWGGWKPEGDKMATSSDTAFIIYDKNYTVAEAQRLERYSQLAQLLQMYDLGQGLMMVAQDPDTRGNDFVFNLLVLQKQMAELGVHPTDAEAKAELERLPSMQEEGKFSPQRAYNIQQAVGMYGMSPADLLELAKLSIGFKRLQDLIGKNYVPSPVETEKAYAVRHQTVKIQTINFAIEDFKKTAQVKDEEIQKYYDENKETYKTEEKRAVSYVFFEEPKEMDKKPKEEQLKIRKEIVDRVNKFNEASIQPGAKFDDIVKALKEKTLTEALFTKATASEAFKAETELLDAVFAHNKDSRPISDPIRGSKGGYYIFTITSKEEPKQQELAAVKDKVKDTLVAQKAQEALTKAVNEARDAIQAGLKDKKKVEDIAKDKKLTLSPVKDFTISEPPTDVPNAYQIAREAENTAAGEVTKAVDTDTGAVIVYVTAKELRKRDDSAMLRKNTEDSTARMTRMRIFSAWFTRKRQEAGVKLPPSIKMA